MKLWEKIKSFFRSLFSGDNDEYSIEYKSNLK